MEAVHVVGEVRARDLRGGVVGVLCGAKVPFVPRFKPAARCWDTAVAQYVYRLTGLSGMATFGPVDAAEVARWYSQITCEACKAALTQEALEGAG